MELSNNGKLAQQLLEAAVEQGASDMHIEPMERDARVRLRVDGLLWELCRMPLNIYTTLVTQLKVMSGMDIAEKRVPQDGRWQFLHSAGVVDLRLATLPTIRGEKVAVRILDRQQGWWSLADLGMSSRNLQMYQKMYAAAHGLVLLTGPTGSGKTTSLYATLRELEQEGLNLVTLEDPVEYRLEGINQVAVNRRAGLDFATGLRSLVRRICPRCMENYQSTTVEQNFLGLTAPRQLVRGRGCEHCHGTGFAGRLAVQELLPVDEYMAELISAGAGKAALLSHGARRGWRSLYADGVNKVLEGQTSVSELWRVGILGEENMGYANCGGQEVGYVH